MAEEIKVAEATVTKAESQTEETSSKKAGANLSGKLQGILATIEELTVIELAQLVKALEEKFGVSAQAQVVAGVVGAVPGAAGGAEAQEEKTSFTIVLTNAGDKKIQVIKEIRAVTNLGLKEAKDLVESAPKPVKDGASKEEAEKIKAALEGAGATVELK